MAVSSRVPAAGAGTRRQALAALCVTEIVSYGVIYYAFPVLAGQIVAATGWSRASVTLAYSAGNLAGALAGIPVGRLLHARGPRLVMTVASVAGAVAVACIAVAPSYGWFLASWLAAGTASAGLYYPPAFAALTAWYGERRVGVLTTLTLAAGFASTIFAPLTSALAAHLSWRYVFLVLAAILAVITIPAHAFFLRAPWRREPGPHAPVPGRDRQVLGSRAFLQLSGAATLCALAQYAALINLVPLLEGRGLSPGLAAWALGLGGAGQVSGRLCYRPLVSRLGARARAATVIGAGAAATMLLGLVPGPAVLLIAASVAAGAIRGVFTLTEATLVADYWGADRYAILNGVFNAPLLAAGALAPGIGAGIAALTGYPALFAILAVACASGAILAATAPSPARREGAQSKAASG